MLIPRSDCCGTEINTKAPQQNLCCVAIWLLVASNSRKIGINTSGSGLKHRLLTRSSLLLLLLLQLPRHTKNLPQTLFSSSLGSFFNKFNQNSNQGVLSSWCEKSWLIKRLDTLHILKQDYRFICYVLCYNCIKKVPQLCLKTLVLYLEEEETTKNMRIYHYFSQIKWPTPIYCWSNKYWKLLNKIRNGHKASFKHQITWVKSTNYFN